MSLCTQPLLLHRYFILNLTVSQIKFFVTSLLPEQKQIIFYQCTSVSLVSYRELRKTRLSNQ